MTHQPPLENNANKLDHKPSILILYYSRSGHTHGLAHAIANGIEMDGWHSAKLRCVPPVRTSWEQPMNPIPDQGPLYATPEDLVESDGIILGSPTRFGNMAAPLQHFIEQLGGLWHDNRLINKPAGAFCSTGSLHGGQEATLLHMLTPLMHLGMIPIGVTYETKALMTTQSGGTPYGPSHCAGPNGTNPLTEDENLIAQAFGKRLSQVAKQLKPLFH